MSALGQKRTFGPRKRTSELDELGWVIPRGRAASYAQRALLHQNRRCPFRAIIFRAQQSLLGRWMGGEKVVHPTAGQWCRAVAIIDVIDDMSDYQIPLGSKAQVAIYTEHWHHLSLLRKILLRMRSWQNYIFVEGHGGGGSGGH